MAPTNEITHRVTRNSQKKRAPSSHSKRFDGRIATCLGVESYDDLVGSKSVRDDFSCPGRLSAKNALTTEQTE
jgi:hypothetical protein